MPTDCNDTLGNLWETTTTHNLKGTHKGGGWGGVRGRAVTIQSYEENRGELGHLRGSSELVWRFDTDLNVGKRKSISINSAFS